MGGGSSMAIEKEEFLYEKEVLEETKNFIHEEIEKISLNDNKLKEKVMELKKQSRGRYSEELDTYNKLYEITHETLKNYTNSYQNPYFARIDFREARREKEIYYIGKVGIENSTEGEEKVIDWRAPIADLYYSGTYGDCYYVAPIGIINGKLELKRKLLLRDGQLKDAFDEGINEIIIKNKQDGQSLIDEFLKVNLEESVAGKLKEVVATIQKEQNDIIRAEKNSAIFIQGSAGSGKTTVALHRLAFLLYKYSQNLKPSEVLVLAPNKLFLDYIGDVLPELGVTGIVQRTFEEIAKEILGVKCKIYTKEQKLSHILESNDDIKYVINASKVKNSMTFKEIMDRYITLITNLDAGVESITVDDYVLFDRKEIRRLFLKDMSSFSINKRKKEIKRYLGNKLQAKINEVKDRIDFTYEYSISKIKKTLEDSKERREQLVLIYEERDIKKRELGKKAEKAFTDFFEAWIVEDTSRLYYKAFKDEELFNIISSGVIPSKLKDYMLKEILLNEENNIIDEDDLIPMLYLKLKIEDVPKSFDFSHIVIDEAQDYSLFCFEVIKLLCSKGSYTIVGDVSQGIYNYRGIESLEGVLKEVFSGKGRYIPLTLSYRSTVEIINFANVVLRKQLNYIEPAKPVLRHGEKPHIEKYESSSDFSKKVDIICEKMRKEGRNSIAIIGKTYEECRKLKEQLKKQSSNSWDLIKDKEKVLKAQNVIVPSYMTKGLEFDCTILYDVSSKVYEDNEGDKKLLYVALTRALHNEFIFYKEEPSKLIYELLEEYEKDSIFI